MAKLIAGPPVGDALTFQEKAPESPDEAWALESGRTRRRYVIAGDAANRFLAAKTFLGFATLRTATVNGKEQRYVSRQTPHALPYKNQSGRPFLFAQAITRTSPTGTAAPS